jgi:hypothetical protein
MIGVSKKFSSSLLKSNDPKSRKVVKEYFAKQNIPLEDNENKYGVDLISKDGSIQIEVEHRLVWKSAEFPFAEVNVPERKAKFFVENHICYVILSEDYSHIGMIDGKRLMPYLITENLKESSNKYVREGEMFYKVPKEAFTWKKI